MKNHLRARTFRVMTWNIGKVYLAWDSRASDDDLDHVAQVIKHINPHIVALQELRDRSQLELLLRFLGDKWWGHVSEDAYDRRAALVSRLPCSFFPLRSSIGRIAQGASVQMPNGEKATFISIHLDAFDAKRRFRQTEETLADAHRKGQDEIFLLGDFNFDVSEVSLNSDDFQLYQLLMAEFEDAGRKAGKTTIVSRRLDYVLFRSQVLDVSYTRVFHEFRINTMDHDPLFVEFSWKTGDAKQTLTN